MYSFLFRSEDRNIRLTEASDDSVIEEKPKAEQKMQKQRLQLLQNTTSEGTDNTSSRAIDVLDAVRLSTLCPPVHWELSVKLPIRLAFQ